MKTSTIFLLATVALLTVSLAVYDFQLRAEVRKGNYAKPLYRYTMRDLRGFNRVELRASTMANMQLERGPFQVATGPDADDFLTTRVEDSTLIVEAHFSDHRRGTNSNPVIYVACPALRSFRSDAWYTVGKDMFTDGIDDRSWNKTTTISGFAGDILDIREENGSDVLLQGNSYKRFTALLGAKKEGYNAPLLKMGNNNHFDSSDLNIHEHGRLEVTGTDIRQLNFHLGDSARLTVSGAAARHLKTN
jgi:hypothetical protein